MRLRLKAGFTAVEMLVTALMVSLITASIVTVSGAALNIRSNELFASESEELAMTLNTSIGDVLHFSTGVKITGGTDSTLTGITNLNYGIKDGSFVLKEDRLYLYTSEDTESALPLVSRGTYTNMKIKDFDIKYNNANNVFEGSYRIEGPKSNQKKTITFAFRPINKPETTL